MAFDVVMPRLGWNMEEGAVVGWRRKDGDPVTAGEILFEVETDKAVQEVEAAESGTLRLPPESPPLGKHVPVGTLLAWLLKPGEVMPAKATPAPAAPETSTAAPPRSSPAVTTAGPAVSGTGPQFRPAEGKRIRVSPRARRVASELGVDWTLLSGTGSSGRILERDVRRAAASRTHGPAAVAGSDRVAPGAAMPSGDVLPISTARRLTAERMSAAAHTAAAVTLTTEADATDLVRLRGQLKGDGAQPAPSYSDLFAKLSADALVHHRELNARFEGDSIVQSSTVNVAIAVDSARGLLAPVVRDVQSKTLRQVARETADLVERARAGRIRPEELRGATFTVTNLGMYEIDSFTPIINLPECAILGVGRIVAKQVVTDADAGLLSIRRMVVLSLTFDHRLVDGAPAARLLQKIKSNVEKPYLWLAGS